MFHLAKDFTVRIWNYEAAKVELVKKYQFDISALALHPTGLFVAIGFSDKLHFMEVLLDTLKTVKSFDFPNCGEIVFSHQGHLLACSYGNMITIISVFSFGVLGSMKVQYELILNTHACRPDEQKKKKKHSFRDRKKNFNKNN